MEESRRTVALTIRLDQSRRQAFEEVLPAIAAFKKAFGRDISVDFIAELYAARELDLELPDGPNQAGADATDGLGKRYQIKCRHPSTLNVDLNSFAFEYLVLVNLDDAYMLTGMWSLPVERAKMVFTFREKFRKYQATQERLKREATKVR
jgi:hypothetical protein